MLELSRLHGGIEQTPWLSIENCMVESRGPQGKVQGSPQWSFEVPRVKLSGIHGGAKWTLWRN